MLCRSRAKTLDCSLKSGWLSLSAIMWQKLFEFEIIKHKVCSVYKNYLSYLVSRLIWLVIERGLASPPIQIGDDKINRDFMFRRDFRREYKHAKIASRRY